MSRFRGQGPPWLERRRWGSSFQSDLHNPAGWSLNLLEAGKGVTDKYIDFLAIPFIIQEPASYLLNLLLFAL